MDLFTLYTQLHDCVSYQTAVLLGVYALVWRTLHSCPGTTQHLHWRMTRQILLSTVAAVACYTDNLGMLSTAAHSVAQFTDLAVPLADEHSVWFGLVWFGLVWFGCVWLGSVWPDWVRFSLIGFSLVYWVQSGCMQCSAIIRHVFYHTHIRPHTLPSINLSLAESYVMLLEYFTRSLTAPHGAESFTHKE